MKRRSFLAAMGTVGTAAISTPATAAEPTAVQATGLPQRTLGRTGKKVSIVGFPGLALVHADQDASTEGIHKAFRRGVNYYDVAPAYGNGDCEIKMGIGLQGLKRSDYFLACKTKMRDKEGAEKELDRSLERLKTDHFDLYQLHHLRTREEVEKALGKGGAMETVLKAQQDGRIRHIGFSAHTTVGALTAMKGFKFDTVMFPINFVEYFTLGFGKAVLELAAEQGAAVLAIKALSRGKWPQDVKKTRNWWYRSMEEPRDVGMALRFTLSQKNVVSAFTPAFLDLLDKALDAAQTDAPVTDEEVAELRKIAEASPSVFRDEEKKFACGSPWYTDGESMACCPCDDGHEHVG